MPSERMQDNLKALGLTVDDYDNMQIVFAKVHGFFEGVGELKDSTGKVASGLGDERLTVKVLALVHYLSYLAMEKPMEEKDFTCFVSAVGTLKKYLDREIKKKYPGYVSEEDKVRAFMWVNHGCAAGSLALYGDDGEMQCNNCFIDFKREPIDEIMKKLNTMALKRLGISKKI